MELTREGLILSTPEEIRESLRAYTRERVANFEELPVDLQNNLIDSSVGAIAYIEQQILLLFNSFSPDFATFPMFEQLGATFGLRQKAKTFASVTVKVSGESGIEIPEGTPFTDSNGGVFVYTSVRKVIPSNGSVEVLCYAREDIAPIEVGGIALSPQLQGVTVTNESPSVGAIKEESEGDYRARVQTTIKGVRNGSLYSFLEKIERVQGVDKRAVRVVPIEYDSAGVGYNGLMVIVGGGDDYDVADVIFNSFLETSKLRNEESQKGTKKELSIKVGNDVFNVKFVRPTTCTIGLNVSFSTSFLTDTNLLKEKIESELSNFLNSITIGTQLAQTEIKNKILDVCEGEGVPIHTIGNITVTGDYTYLGEEKQAIEFDSMGWFSPALDTYIVGGEVVAEVSLYE